jgi:fluoroquinolone transport system permease protein
MIKLFYLFQFELKRLWMYKVLPLALLVTSMWVLILALVNAQQAINLLPFVLMLDAGVMAIMFFASSYYFEKQEGTLKNQLVTPIPSTHLLTAKLLAILTPSIVSVLFVALTMAIFHSFTFPYLLAIIIMVIATLSHLTFGFVIVFIHRDFMAFLVTYSLVVIVFLIPSLLSPFVEVESFVFQLFYLSPTFSGQQLMGSIVSDVSSLNAFIATLGLIIYPLFLFPLYIVKRFEKEVVVS